ncbi:MAG: endonuclease/exonuclease/phosphatase family protein [Armatimonadaceae bacterium]|jgi:endonuclease/exonuclease/phosphatase family metal-dependent hydrolase
MRLEVMTLNLLHAGAVNPAGTWAERLPRVVSLLAGGPDIAGLQEATLLQLDDLARALPDYVVVPGPSSGESRLPRFVRRIAGFRRRHAAAPSHNNGSPHRHGLHARGEHCAILFRGDRFELIDSNAFWISHRSDQPGSVLPGTWLPRVVNWVRLRERSNGRELLMYNAHVDFLPWAPFRSTRILRHMLDRHWDGTPQFLTGDFNTLGDSRAYRHLCTEVRHGFHPPLADAWLCANERLGPARTFHGGTGRPRWAGRLDRILFRPHAVVDRAQTVVGDGDGHLSDHFPVTAVFQGVGE